MPTGYLFGESGCRRGHHQSDSVGVEPFMREIASPESGTFVLVGVLVLVLVIRGT
jgi:hypothetical protein